MSRLRRMLGSTPLRFSAQKQTRVAAGRTKAQHLGCSGPMRKKDRVWQPCEAALLPRISRPIARLGSLEDCEHRANLGLPEQPSRIPLGHLVVDFERVVLAPHCNGPWRQAWAR